MTKRIECWLVFNHAYNLVTYISHLRRMNNMSIYSQQNTDRQTHSARQTNAIPGRCACVCEGERQRRWCLNSVFSSGSAMRKRKPGDAARRCVELTSCK